MIARLKPYRFLLAMLGALGLSAALSPSVAVTSLRQARASTLDMLALLPPVLILIGLLEVWVPRETVARHLGSGAGARGLVVPLVMGSVAAGPLYAAFPVAAMLLAKGARPANVFFFLGVWSGAKLPIVMFESAVMGPAFTTLHVAVSVLGSLGFAYLMELLLGPRGLEGLAQQT